MIRAPIRFSLRFSLVVAIGSLGLASPLLAMPAPALPFDPLPSAFERWLNQQRHWPKEGVVHFSNLADCSDQTRPGSPYSQPVYTCLAGTVVVESSSKTSLCNLSRLSYYPASRRVRYWTAQNCLPRQMTRYLSP